MAEYQYKLKQKVKETSMTGTGASFTAGSGENYAAPFAFNKNTNAKGTKNIYYYKLDNLKDSIQNNDPKLKDWIIGRIKGFDVLEKKLNALIPLMQRAKQDTITTYQSKPNYSILYGTDLASDYIDDLITMFKK